MSPRGRAASGAVVAVLTTAGSVVSAGAPVPANASPGRCTSSHGVRVAVEFNQLGGRDLHRCDQRGGGRTAAQILDRQGLTVTYVQRYPGFLCRLAGVPARDPCVSTPADDAYWSLWWSDGSGPWRYASTGVDGLEVPDGGFVALAWDGVEGDVAPTTSPGATVGAAGAEPGRPGSRPGARRTTEAGLPVWVAPGAIGLLVAAAVGAAALRRRRAGPWT